MGVERQLPQYRSHKLVWALKIHSIERDGWKGGAKIVPEDTLYEPFEVDAAYMEKHQPKVGGYYVVYEDGYKSWSPAEAFEQGHTRIDRAPSECAHQPLRKENGMNYSQMPETQKDGADKAQPVPEPFLVRHAHGIRSNAQHIDAVADTLHSECNQLFGEPPPNLCEASGAECRPGQIGAVQDATDELHAAMQRLSTACARLQDGLSQ